MTIFTDGLVERRDRNLLDDVASGQWESAKAAFDEAWFQNPTTALRRMGELNTAEQGRVITPAYPAYNIPEQRAEPDTPLITAEQARQQVADAGVKLNIEESGIRQGALDILIQRKQAERQRQMVLDSAPGSSVPLQLLAGFGASVLDPINIASAFIPVVGEARTAALLERAGSSVAARLGARAQVGAIEGAVGAAAVEPIVLAASAQDQSDYGIKDSLLNIAFGSVLGGGLHGAGGFVSDRIRGNVLSDVRAEAGGDAARAPGEAGSEGLRVPGEAATEAAVPTEVSRRTSLAEAISRGDDNPMQALRTSLERGIDADRQNILESARLQARDEVLPQIRSDIDEAVAGRVANAADLRAEQRQLQTRLDGLDDTYRTRAKEFQQQRMTRKQAERAARDAIAAEREQITTRMGEINDGLDVNRASEAGRRERAALGRGEIPERYNAQIEARAQQIAGGFELNNTARFVAENSPWQIRQAALRSAIAQATTGRDVDVQALFDLPDPIKRTAAMEQLTKPAAPRVDREGTQVSARMDELSASPDTTDLAEAERQLADELALTDEAARNAGLDTAELLRDANTLVADSDTYAAAYRAAAVCQLRK